MCIAIQQGRGYVYDLQYHIVFCTKYRKKILTGQTEEMIKQILYDQAIQHDVEIRSLEVMPDHVHLLLRCKPQHYIPDLMKALKGNTARFLLKAFPVIHQQLCDGHLWSPSYFIASVSDVTSTVIEQYIQSQKTEKDKRGRKKQIQS